MAAIEIENRSVRRAVASSKFFIREGARVFHYKIIIILCPWDRVVGGEFYQYLTSLLSFINILFFAGFTIEGNHGRIRL